jgi:serine/threonine protein phosphatase PrpC
MILSYDFSNQGSSHIESGKPNQDAKKTVVLKSGVVIAAVADGVGSCKFADHASEIAVKVSAEYCEAKLKDNSDNLSLETIIEEAFAQAELEIEKVSLKDKQPLPEYDTTLDLVIYDGKRVTYGHCGDGGIIGLSNKGDYLKITSPQKKEGMYVVPLRNGSKNKNNTWVFGHTDKNIASVFLASDGIYDQFFPYLLKGQPVEVYIPLARYFMDNNELKISKNTLDTVKQKRECVVNGKIWSGVTDDKTFVVLVNEDVSPEKKDASYYEEPNWTNLQLEWDKKANPHLHENKNVASNKKAESTAYAGKKKHEYEIGLKPLKGGGEGQIHNINGQSSIIAKLFHKNGLSKELEDKIQFMVDNPVGLKGHNQIDWPQDILYDNEMNFVGYVMPKLHIGESLPTIYDGSAKHQNITWQDKIEIADNICTVLEAIHQSGHCCGYLHPNNIIVEPQTRYVSFWGSDSFQIKDGKEIYHCTTVGHNYLSAEILKKLQAGYNSKTSPHPIFSRDSDNFVLAIIIFKLLMNGCHPFAVAVDRKEPIADVPLSIDDNILSGKSLFMQDIPGLKRPKYAPSIDILPKQITKLFKRAFIDGHNAPEVRPRPKEWYKPLKKLKNSLGQCETVPHHLYYKRFWELKPCPWCEIDKLLNKPTENKIPYGNFISKSENTKDKT